MGELTAGAMSTLSPAQLKNARLLLRMSQSELGHALGRGLSAVNMQEKTRGACTKCTELAIKFLLVEAGLYSHFRMLYLNKKDLKIEPAYKVVRRKTPKNRLITDALAFKYDR